MTALEKFFAKHPYVLMALIIVLLAAILITLFVNTGEKTPMTGDLVYEELENLGYVPVDNTDYYANQNQNLRKCVVADSGHVHFYFFEFNNNGSSWSQFGTLQSQIYESREYGYNDWSEHYNNYAMYAMVSKYVYYKLIWVDNTLVYAYCNDEYRGELAQILNAIGYS